MTSSRVTSFRRRNCHPLASSAQPAAAAVTSGTMRIQPEAATAGGQVTFSGIGAPFRNRPNLVDIRSILSLDDFEAFCAQASSGGSLYGMLRKQALTSSAASGASSSKPAPGSRMMLRQRSKSLIQRSVALSEEKSIIKLLCDYTETNKAKHRLMQDNRRHSEAALLCGGVPDDMYGARRKPSPLRQKQPLLTASQYLMPHKYGTAAPSSPGVSASNTTFGSKELDHSPPVQTGLEGSSSSSHLLPPSPEQHHRSSLVPPSGGGGTSTSLAARRSICRRRSFSLTRNGGLVNDGDEMVVLPTSPTLVSSEVLEFDQSTNASCGGVDSYERRVSTMSAAAAPPTTLRSRTCSIMSPSAVRDVISSCQAAQPMQPDDVIAAAATAAAAASAKEVPVFRVLMLGGPGVGKTALTQQFVTSEYIAAQNTSFDDGITIPIPVQLEGEESVIEFVDLPYNGDMNIWREHDADGYIIVYSITDRRSYQKAVDLLYSIRADIANTKPVILAANKSDLERSRVIGKQEGKSIAETYTSKYIDVSAILNHHVDELLVGILKQLRLHLVPPSTTSSSGSARPPGTSPSTNRRKGYSFRMSRKTRDNLSAATSPSAAHPSSMATASSASGSVIDMNCFKSASTLSRSRGSLLKRIVRRSLRRRHSKSCENLLRL